MRSLDDLPQPTRAGRVQGIPHYKSDLADVAIVMLTLGMRKVTLRENSARLRWRAFLFSLPFFLCCRSALGQATRTSLNDYFSHARELEKSEDYAGAESVYQEAAKHYPNQPEVLKRLGIVYQTELKLQESIDVFQQVLHGAPQYPEVNF